MTITSAKSISTRLPNFLVIGAAKSGTTSMARYLAQHPEVFVSRFKEPNYFAFAEQDIPDKGPASAEVIRDLIHRHTINTFSDYVSLFHDADDELAVGEASVRYLYFPDAPKKIADVLDQPKMIAILREPVSRMYSHYCMNRQFLLEPLDNFESALEAESQRQREGWGWDWHYASVSRYADQIRRYFDLFGRENLKVILYDEYCAEPLSVFHDICRYLGVSDDFVPDMARRGKVAYEPINAGVERWLHWPNPNRERLEKLLPRSLRRALMTRISEFNRRPAPRLKDELRSKLLELFRDDIQQLESLIGRPTGWLT